MHSDFSNLLQGAYDLHIHVAPSPFHRLMDEFSLLHDAQQNKMAGLLLKSHYESTAVRAALANSYAHTNAIAYGALVLNQPVGGLNPYAVENAARRGAKVIFMPTRDAQNSLAFGNMPGDFFHRPGISILTPDQKLVPAVYDVIDVVKRYDITLATGHLSPQESLALCKAGIRSGIRMVFTHPEFSRTRLDPQMQKELAQAGVLIEKCWYNIAERECSAAQMAQTIRQIGAEHCFLTTDRGQGNRESPVEGMLMFLSTLFDCGIMQQELTTMLHDTPKKVLGL